MKRFTKNVLMSLVALVLLSALCVFAAADPAVPNVNVAIPGQSASGIVSSADIL